MEFHVNSTMFGCEDEINRLLEGYPALSKYNPIIKEYQVVYRNQTSVMRGLFIEVNSLEELVKLSNEIYKSLIINDNNHVYDMNNKRLNTIEIDDGLWE